MIIFICFTVWETECSENVIQKAVVWWWYIVIVHFKVSYFGAVFQSCLHCHSCTCIYEWHCVTDHLQVVNVWEHSSKERKATLKQSLYGHTEPVTCLTSSAAYSLIVSGSRDRTCILWDMSRLVYVNQLRGHVAPVAAVAINELTVSG